MARKNILDITAQKFAAKKTGVAAHDFAQVGNTASGGEKNGGARHGYAAARRLSRCAADDALH